MGDFYRGYCSATNTPVSDAVAASSAFPPGFSALRLALPRDAEFSREDPWGEMRVVSPKRPGELEPGNRPEILLTDGGVYDNLGVEPVWKTYQTLLVSDAGRPFQSLENSGQGIIQRLKRAADISMEQVGAVRRRWLVDEFVAGRRTGGLWTVHSRLEDFPLPDKQGLDAAACALIRSIRTDLDAFSAAEIECLENHGYWLADAAVRSYAPKLCSDPVGAFRWPHGEWAGQANLAEVLEGSSKRKIFRDAVRYLGSFFSRGQVGSTKG